MDFDDSFDLYQQNLDFDFADFTADPTIRKLAAIDKKFNDIERQISGEKLPSVRTPRSLTLGALHTIKARNYKENLRNTVGRINDAPEAIWRSLNTLAVLSPGSVPLDILQGVNTKKKQLTAINKQIQSTLEKVDSKTPLPDDVIRTIADLATQKRTIEESFTKGIDESTLRLAREVEKSTIFEERYRNDYDKTLGSIEGYSRDLYQASSHIFDFFKTGDLKAAANTLIDSFTSIYDRYFTNLAKSVRIGNFAKQNPTLRKFKFSKLLTRSATSSFGKVLGKLISSVGRVIFDAIAKLAGPIGIAVAAITGIATFFLSKQKERAEFNDRLLRMTGLLGQAQAMDFSIKDADSKISAFFNSYYDYLRSKVSKIDSKLSDGTTVRFTTHAVDLGISGDKYMDILEPLLNAGASMRDIEAEFGRSLIGNKLGLHMGTVTNIRTPLEGLYITSQLFNTDPAELAKVAGEWRSSFGELLGTTNTSLQQMYFIANHGKVNVNSFRESVIELSDSFSHFSSQSTALATRLGRMLQKGALSIDQAKSLLEGTLQEMLGYSIQDISHLITVITPEKAKRFFESAQSELDKAIANEERIAKSSTASAAAASRSKIEVYRALRARIVQLAKDPQNMSTDLSKASSAVHELLRLLPDLGIALGDAVTESRYRALMGQDLRNVNLNMTEQAQVRMANESLGRPDSASDFTINTRLQTSKGTILDIPMPDPKRLEEISTRAALAIAQRTLKFSDQLESTTESLGDIIYNLGVSFISKVKSFYNFIVGASDDSNKDPQSPQVLSAIPSAIDVTSTANLPGTNRTSNPPDRITGITVVPASGMDVNTQIQAFSKARTTAHFYIDSKGNIYRTLDERKKATLAGLPPTSDIVISVAADPKARANSPASLGLGLALNALLTEYGIDPSKITLSKDLPQLQQIAEVKQAAQVLYTATIEDRPTYNSLPALSRDLTSNNTLNQLFFASLGKLEGTAEIYKNYTAETFFSALYAYLDTLNFNELHQLYAGRLEEGKKKAISQGIANILGVTLNNELIKALIKSYIDYNNDYNDRLKASKGTPPPTLKGDMLAYFGDAPSTAVRNTLEQGEIQDKSFREKLGAILKGQDALITQQKIDVYVGETLNAQKLTALETGIRGHNIWNRHEERNVSR